VYACHRQLQLQLSITFNNNIIFHSFDATPTSYQCRDCSNNDIEHEDREMSCRVIKESIRV